MVSSSFAQTSFLGGEWSPLAQGRMADPLYKTGMNVCYNSYPVEAGAWTRRSGVRYLAHTKSGNPARLRAFDFNITQPYQMEFTDGFLRFFAGLSLLTTELSDGDVFMDHVFVENPVRISSATPFPTTWVDGDTVVFDLPSVPASCTALLGRQFLIANLDIDFQTFTLQDAITGEDVDGTSFVYNTPVDGSTPDKIFKVLELATPYTGDQWSNVRTVQNSTDCLVLNQSVQPYLIAKGDIGEGDPQFVINPQDFEDGPYLDINDTTTTCVLGGLTGSVSVTFTSTTGVNHGLGLQSTDVGRLLRFQGGPVTWDSGTTYTKQAIVLGSDNNVYTSVVGGNIGHDPTTDDSSHWQIAAETITWTWLKITVVANDTTATATIMGPDLQRAAATTSWQLGLYSDTTGWPSCGTYHDGRLWLGGRNFDFLNRVDGSKSNDFFNFAPTEADGTTTDASAVAAEFNAKDVNAVLWMLSTEDGLIIGTQAGEWRIKASALDDPVTDTSISARRISSYGCADIEPCQPGGQTVFVQRQGRRLLAHEQITANRYVARNLTKKADHTTVGGLQEIAWQQEPLLALWGRTAAGALVGCTYSQRTNAEDETIIAFHRQQLANGRLVTSLQGGPAYDGLSDALYLVTNAVEGQPDEGVHWVQVLMPLFDAAQADWAAYFTDGGSNPPYAQLYQTANGDSFDGVRIFGLWPLNGLTVAPVIGGLDLGDRVVADGFVDVPFSSDPDRMFTLAFFQGLSNGMDYGVFEVQTGSITSGTVAPPIAANTLLAYVGNDATVVGNGGAQYMLNGPNGDFVYQMSIGSTTPGIRKFEASNGFEDAQTARSMTSTTYYLHTNGFIYASIGPGNTVPIEEISTDTTAFGAGTSYGAASSSFAGSSPGNFQCMMGPICGFSLRTHDYIVFSGIRAAQQINEVTLCEVGGQVTWVNIAIAGVVGTYRVPNSAQVQTISSQPKTYVSLCMGPVSEEWASWFALEKPYPGTWPADNSIQVALHKFTFDQPTQTLNRVPFVSFTPSDFDATWTTMSDCIGIGRDVADDCVIFFVETTDSVTNQHYAIKYDPWNLTFVWKIALDVAISTTDQYLGTTVFNGKFVFVHAGVGNHNMYVIDTIAGTLTKTAINTGFTFAQQQFYDKVSGSVTFFGSFSPPGTGPVMHYIGAYLPANGDTLGNQWGRLHLGVDYPTGDVNTTYSVPASLGTTYTSQGQLLRPDYGADAGARNGPAFGKIRRLHWYAMSFYRSRGVTVGTDFLKLRPALMQTASKKPLLAPTLYSGPSTNTVDNDYGFEGQVAWQITRPYPATVTAIGGYLETVDK